MNYRKVYMRIVLNAKKEMSLGIRPKNDFQRRKNFEKYYFELHHILPKSIFPLWKNRKSNLVFLTAREHFFCYQLLTKIWPCRELYAAFNFLSYHNSGVKRKLTSSQYEEIKKNLSKANKLFAEQRWTKRDGSIGNVGKHWKIEDTSRYKAANRKRVLEMKPGQKYGSLILGEDGKFHKDPNCKSFGGKGKKRPSAGAKISKAIKGSHIYNNGIINKRAFECPEGFVPGKLKK